MLLDLKGHYLDLLVKAVEAHGNVCLHRPDAIAPDKGAIFAVRSKTSTQCEFVIQYHFDDVRVALQVEFTDARQPLQFASLFVKGIDALWPKLTKALASNRLTNKAAA